MTHLCTPNAARVGGHGRVVLAAALTLYVEDKIAREKRNKI
jgi:hypothetical protein